MSARLSKRRIIGAVTIGQTPRDDVVPPMREALGDRFEVVETGALDGLSEDEVRDRAGKAGGAWLVTRLRGGGEVEVREEFLVPRLQDCVRHLESCAELIMFLCTGDFPSLKSSLPVLYPGPLLRHVVRSLGPSRLGVLTPSRKQIEPQCQRWREVAGWVAVEPASPYGRPEELEAAVARLCDAHVDMAVMDCIGYTKAMRRQVRVQLDRPVLLASGLLAKVAAELIE